MRDRYLSLTAVAGVVGVAIVAAVSLTGQTTTPAKPAASKAPTKAAAKSAGVPRTAWGDPDIQGTWFVLWDVPLERSAANANKQFLTDAEVDASDTQKGLNPGRNSRSNDKAQDVSGAYNAVFN